MKKLIVKTQQQAEKDFNSKMELLKEIFPNENDYYQKRKELLNAKYLKQKQLELSLQDDTIDVNYKNDLLFSYRCFITGKTINRNLYINIEGIDIDVDILLKDINNDDIKKYNKLIKMIKNMKVEDLKNIYLKKIIIDYNGKYEVLNDDSEKYDFNIKPNYFSTKGMKEFSDNYLHDLLLS